MEPVRDGFECKITKQILEGGRERREHDDGPKFKLKVRPRK